MKGAHLPDWALSRAGPQLGSARRSAGEWLAPSSVTVRIVSIWVVMAPLMLPSPMIHAVARFTMGLAHRRTMAIRSVGVVHQRHGGHGMHLGMRSAWRDAPSSAMPIMRVGMRLRIGVTESDE
ncbi:hypothetical protein LMG23994_00977 [Cupriavidus pinatubonensis]|uniref:Uncharacterized protein n=2 Tax=Cupriavidus pinatubonensis TaxID=248026 RepID=A0ABN7XZ75_9BURK|nr:hypothetical protein LMG23994_00977 [Cupriavidus pinatubonensis]